MGKIHCPKIKGPVKVRAENEGVFVFINGEGTDFSSVEIMFDFSCSADRSFLLGNSFSYRYIIPFGEEVGKIK